MNHIYARILGVVGFLALLATPRVAPGEPATSSPTTAPGESPRAALKAYNAAMRAGDVDGIVALQHAANETEARVARAVAKSEVEVARLLSAARAKFGAEGAAALGRAIGDVSDADIDASTQTITGERAVLRFMTGGAAPMVRADGEWKASVADTIRGSGGNPQDAIDRFTRRGSFARSLAQAITDGKVKTVEDAIARIEKHERGTDDDDPAN